MLKNIVLALTGIFVMLAAGCASKAQVEKAIADDPDIVFKALDKNPDKLLDLLTKASNRAQEKQAAEEAKRHEEEYKNPRSPAVANDRAVRGKFGAPITVVEYSDFQCPYCKMGAKITDDLRAKYGERLRVVFKHLPLDFHEMAMPSAKYFEAIALQSPDKAYEFHDYVFKNQDQLGAKKEKFLQTAAKKAGANMAQLKKDLDSDEVKRRIKSDMDEAKSYGINGTPGFVVQGITVAGVAPTNVYEEIIERRLKEGDAGAKRDVSSVKER